MEPNERIVIEVQIPDAKQRVIETAREINVRKREMKALKEELESILNSSEQLKELKDKVKAFTAEMKSVKNQILFSNSARSTVDAIDLKKEDLKDLQLGLSVALEVYVEKNRSTSLEIDGYFPQKIEVLKKFSIKASQLKLFE